VKLAEYFIKINKMKSGEIKCVRSEKSCTGNQIYQETVMNYNPKERRCMGRQRMGWCKIRTHFQPGLSWNE
jgi:hypothetical protein